MMKTERKDPAASPSPAVPSQVLILDLCPPQIPLPLRPSTCRLVSTFTGWEVPVEQLQSLPGQALKHMSIPEVRLESFPW